jgi:hypothetical protein
MLLTEVEHLAQDAGVLFTEDEVLFRADSSRLLPHVVYYWAFYSPGQLVDAHLSLVGATVYDTALVLRDARDWTLLAEKSGWIPSNDNDAVRGCLEAARTITPEADGFVSPVIYMDSTTLMQDWVVGESSAPVSALSPPQANWSEVRDEWTVRFWAIEFRQTTLYDCFVGVSGSVRLEPRDTIRELQLMGYGP